VNNNIYYFLNTWLDEHKNYYLV